MKGLRTLGACQLHNKFMVSSASSPTTPVPNRRFLIVTLSERSANCIGGPEHGRDDCSGRLSGQKPRSLEAVDCNRPDLAEDPLLRYLLQKTGRW